MNCTFTVAFNAPFRTGSGHGRAGLFDQTPLFDSSGRIYIPGSAIKGKLRHLCYHLIISLAADGIQEPLKFAELCPDGNFRGNLKFCRGDEPCAFCRLFGSPLHQGSYVFEDAHLTDEMDFVKTDDLAFLRASQTEVRPRVSLERSRRTTKKGHLLIAENSAPYLKLRGRIHRIHGPDDHEAAILLRYSIDSLTHLGAGSAVGYGRLSAMEVTA